MAITSCKKAETTKKHLTTHPGDAGASPEWASVLAAVEALDDRASAPDGGVGRRRSRRYLRRVFGREVW
jgi:hypothetical protein